MKIDRAPQTRGPACWFVQWIARGLLGCGSKQERSKPGGDRAHRCQVYRLIGMNQIGCIVLTRWEDHFCFRLRSSSAKYFLASPTRKKLPVTQIRSSRPTAFEARSRASDRVLAT